MPEEAFYLAGGVGLLGVHATLNIFFATKEPSLSVSALWAQLRLAAGEQIERASTSQTPTPSNLLTRLDLDREFAVKYAAYHYYRSRGWVVKSGIKFGAEYVLYKRGPIFRHSDYAVAVIPALDAGDPEGHSVGRTRDWQWALTLNRVCAQANKKVLLCHVLVPGNMTRAQLNSPNCLRRLKVWDVCMGRWIPQKTRD
ncbi:tRNA intron endonuclease [Geranomyces variabilis]|nr:tRNA intron endonuclease [Geranomyces variabilis]KAJ3142116.1 tRNA splicing endonuclease subunit sen2 [Geranomyces variabilis]